jgi:phosphatidylglycerol:prolipoprotein diacylglycerol transferase
MLLNNLPAIIFGFFLSAALVTAVLVIIAEARMLGGDENKIKDLCFWMMTAAIIGGRLAYVAANPDILWKDLMALFRIWEGGVIYYGGLVAALVEMFVFTKKNNLPLGKTVDILAPGIAVGHFFGLILFFFTVAGHCI